MVKKENQLGIRMKQKKTFSLIFGLLSVFMIVLPFLVTFNEGLTKVIENINGYIWIQGKIVPVEIKMVGVLVSPFGVEYQAHVKGLTINGVYAQMTWNCLGWQSLLLLLITFIFGLRGNYTLLSKIEAIIIGLVGTFLVNLFRLTFIVLLLGFSQPLFARVYHDYLAAFVTIIWLFFFWWFSYKFVLELVQTTPKT